MTLLGLGYSSVVENADQQPPLFKRSRTDYVVQLCPIGAAHIRDLCASHSQTSLAWRQQAEEEGAKEARVRASKGDEMEISGIGGYRDDLLARSSVTSTSTTVGTGTSSQLLEKPPAARSVASTAYSGGGDGQRLAGGHRASEPIMLDFDLPANPQSSPEQAHQHQKRGSSRLSKRKSMPRLDNLTPTVHLSEEGKAELKQAAENRIERTLLKCQAAWDGTSGIFDDPKNWKPHMTKPNLSVYRRVDGPGIDQSTSTYRPFVATGRIPGLTLQDLEYGLYAETTPDERAVNAFWFGDYFLDAAVLETYETQTEEDPFHFFGMKWLLSGSIGGMKLLSPRDNAFMQYTKTVTNEFGEKILVKVDQSVPEEVIPFIPDQGDLHFVRSEISIIYMYHYDPKAKEVQVFCEGKIDPAGRTPSFMANLNLSLFSPLIVHLDHIADAKYITKHGLMFPHSNSPTRQSSFALSVSTHIPSPMASSAAGLRLSQLTASWVPDKNRKACFVCFKGFSLLRRRRHHCRMCGEVMCSQCMVALPLVAPPQFDAEKNANFPLVNQPESKKLEDTNPHGFPVVNHFKFCKKCMLAIRQERRAMAAGVGNYYFTQGMIHHHGQMQAAFAGQYDGNQFDDDNEEEGNESGYLDDSIEDDWIVDDIQYSRHVERLRQEHMEREKQKLREQSQKRQARVSVRLFDELASSTADSDLDAAGLKQSGDNNNEVHGLEDLLITDQKKLVGTKGDATTSRSDRELDNATAESNTITSSPIKAVSPELVPPTAESDGNSTGDAPHKSFSSSSLLPIDVRRRSFSIPKHFERMEQSIAEQEALLTSIQQQRAKTKAEIGDGAPSRLPIGAAMQSMARTMSMGGSNQEKEIEAGDAKPSSAATASLSTESSQSPQ